MDAYDGTMTFYVADPTTRSSGPGPGVFPTLFQPISEMPADLVPHLRVPEELFDVQTRMYGRYHVVDPTTFYTNNDLWTVPIGQTNEQSLPTEAYYVVMRMPGADNAEFLLLQPMIPSSRPEHDRVGGGPERPADYGKTTVFRFPSQTSMFGPAQIEAQIDIDPEISAQITLWNQSGSTVIRGNLIVCRSADSLIYLQPVYLQSTSSKFPAFQRIVVASSTHVVWAPTLERGARLFLAEQARRCGPGPSPTPDPEPDARLPSAAPARRARRRAAVRDVSALIAYANQHFELAQAGPPRRRLRAVRRGDRAGPPGASPSSAGSPAQPAVRRARRRRSRSRPRRPLARAVTTRGATVAALLAVLGRPTGGIARPRRLPRPRRHPRSSSSRS